MYMIITFTVLNTRSLSNKPRQMYMAITFTVNVVKFRALVPCHKKPRQTEQTGQTSSAEAV